MPICLRINDQSFPLLSFPERLSNSFCLTLLILPAIISISSFHSLKRAVLPTILATTLAPCTGGFEYMGRASLFSWLFTLRQTKGMSFQQRIDINCWSQKKKKKDWYKFCSLLLIYSSKKKVILYGRRYHSFFVNMKIPLEKRQFSKPSYYCCLLWTMYVCLDRKS